MSVITITSQTAGYTVGVTDQAIRGDATSGDFTITLPTAATAGMLFSIKKVDTSANIITIAASGGQLIDGVATLRLTESYQSIALMSNGTNWEIR